MKILKDIWHWLPGLYRILICLSPICGIFFAWVYLVDRDSVSLIQSVLTGLGFTAAFGFGAMFLALLNGLVSLILGLIIGLIKAAFSSKE